MKRIRQKGAILLTVSIMITAIAILVLSLMQDILLRMAASNSLVLNHQAFYQLEAIAFKLSKFENFASVSHCLLQQKPPNQLISLLETISGCSYVTEGRTYHYLIADLGEYPCLQIIERGRNYGSHHWLITVASPQHAIIQLRLAQPDSNDLCEETQVRLIRQGILSWRYLPNYHPSPQSRL